MIIRLTGQALLVMRVRGIYAHATIHCYSNGMSYVTYPAFHSHHPADLSTLSIRLETAADAYPFLSAFRANDALAFWGALDARNAHQSTLA